MGELLSFPPSNRGGKRPDFRHEGDGGSTFGVDRLSLSFPVAEGFDPRSFTSETRNPETGEVRSLGVQLTGRDSPGGSVFVGVMHVPEAGWRGKVEANPARFVDPGGCSLLPVDRVPDAVSLLATAVERVGLRPLSDVGSWRVRRLDVARDFRGVLSPGFYVRGLLNVRRPYARRTFMYADPARGNAETLYAGSGAGGVRLYDQHRAYASKGAPVGSLRWEVEARSGWLDKVGVRRVDDVSAGAVGALASERWEWSAMGTEVTGTDDVVERVNRLVLRYGECRLTHDDGCDRCLSPARGQRLLGQLVGEALGVSWSVSRTTAADYARWKSRLGVVPAAELFGGVAEVPCRGRLDWESGSELVAA